MGEELEATSLVASLRRLMANKAFSKLILKLSKPKSIERVLAIYAGLQEATSIREAIACKVIAKALAKSAAKFGVREEALKSGLKDPYIRRALANIMLGIAYYGVTKPQKLYAPFMVVWDFTLQCNLRCKHCYANAGRSSPPDELTLSEKLEVLKQLDEAGVAALSFSGGEPLISRD
ncbi:MAG: radical SAM/SPASM domain-containing protein, partial [Thermoprotei archaeon]